MRWVNFDVLEVQQIDPKHVTLIKLQNVPVNADMVKFIVPAAIPSEIAGPDGSPTSKMGAVLHFVGVGLQGPGLMVDCTKEQAMWKLANESVVVIDKTPDEVKGQNSAVGKPHLKLIHPND